MFWCIKIGFKVCKTRISSFKYAIMAAGTMRHRSGERAYPKSMLILTNGAISGRVLILNLYPSKLPESGATY